MTLLKGGILEVTVRALRLNGTIYREGGDSFAHPTLPNATRFSTFANDPRSLQAAPSCVTVFCSRIAPRLCTCAPNVTRGS